MKNCFAEMKRATRDVLFSDSAVRTFVVVGVCFLAFTLGAVTAAAQANPYATPDYVDRFSVFEVAIRPILDGVSNRITEITSLQLDLLQALTNNNFSKMSALFFALPIESWSHLYDVKYVSKTSKSGDSQRVVDYAGFMLWYCIFDLPLGDALHPPKLDDDGDPIYPWLQN